MLKNPLISKLQSLMLFFKKQMVAMRQLQELKKKWLIAQFLIISQKELMRSKTLKSHSKISKLISSILRLIMLRVQISQFKARLKLKNLSIRLIKNFSTLMKKESNLTSTLNKS